ncbi:hypothetical protein ACN4EE_22920 [Geminocystis sp. CENA526]|uniref:hypothetical protein n=1 Tax=Geminocystis sp. CENA526 TaxID=1355871 RepID=UPI003D6FAC85
MNNLPREKLIQIIKEQGSNLCNNPSRCKGFLLDYCGEYRAEIKVLIDALYEGIATDLLNISQGTPKESILARSKKKLMDLSFQEEASQWAVETWALALGVVTESELKETKHSSSFNVSPQTNEGKKSQQFPESENQHLEKKRLEVEKQKQLELERQQLETARKIKQEEERQRDYNEKINIEKQIRIEAERKLKEKETQDFQRLQKERLEAKTRRKNTILGVLLGLFLSGITIIFSLIQNQNQLEQQQVREEVTPPPSPTKPQENIQTLIVSDGSQERLVIENLYSALSAKNYQEAQKYYIPQLSDVFNPSFFDQFVQVTVDNLQTTIQTVDTLTLVGQNTYYYPDGSTQIELRSYTVQKNHYLIIVDSDFIKVTKFR